MMILQLLFSLSLPFCVFLPCLIYQWYFLRRDLKRETVPLSNMIWRFLFIFYLYLVIDTTGVGTLWDALSYPEIIRPEEINLVPFADGSLTLGLLNAFMFMPLGFLLPYIWNRFRRWLPVVLLAVSFSLTIEILQLFNRRVSDVEDLMMNTLGAFLGFLIWQLWQKIVKKDSKDIQALGKNEATAYIFLSLAGVFFLHNWRFFLRFL
ncbi:VanZ family protein [Enterococcus sp. AZ109]|uniref:VanZ family protein n=1 Tax=Enterococcus sp. AZ109 TaxID=2774634 RepID=UPI003F2483F3